MHAFDVLGDPVRRRILELLAEGEQSSGAITGIVRAEFGISQPAVSQHLRVLRDNGFATVRPEGARRIYAVGGTALGEADAWLGRFRRFWTPHLDALATEIARGKRSRRLTQPSGETGAGEAAAGEARAGETGAGGRSAGQARAEETGAGGTSAGEAGTGKTSAEQPER